MSNKRIYNILKGKYLVDKDAFKNWLFILFCTFLAIVMIAYSHKAERKIHRMAQLQKEERQLRSEFVDQRQQLMQMRMESAINQRLKEKGITIATSAPQKIIVTR